MYISCIHNMYIYKIKLSLNRLYKATWWTITQSTGTLAPLWLETKTQMNYPAENFMKLIGNCCRNVKNNINDHNSIFTVGNRPLCIRHFPSAQSKGEGLPRWFIPILINNLRLPAWDLSPTYQLSTHYSHVWGGLHKALSLHQDRPHPTCLFLVECILLWVLSESRCMVEGLERN